MFSDWQKFLSNHLANLYRSITKVVVHERKLFAKGGPKDEPCRFIIMFNFEQGSTPFSARHFLEWISLFLPEGPQPNIIFKALAESNTGVIVITPSPSLELNYRRILMTMSEIHNWEVVIVNHDEETVTTRTITHREIKERIEH
jgi:hypothetical protein